MGRAVRLVLVTTIVVVGAGVATFVASPASAKEFSIVAVAVDATVRPDGAMEVVEHLTYDFDGTFNVGDRDIPPSSYYDVVDMRASEDGRPLTTLNSNPSSFEWDLDGATGRHTYEISYTAVGAVRVGPDVGELYWKFIGTDFPRVGSVDVTITFPGDGDGLRAWAHGPASGEVRPSGNIVTLEVDDVPAGTFVEARVAYPSENFTVAPSGGERLPGILEEEKEFADRANAERQRKKIAQVVSPLVALCGLVSFFAIWRKWGREPAPPPDVGDYWRDLPPDTPAVVLALEKDFSSIGGPAFAATIVDLAQRGWLTIEERREDRLIRSDDVDYVFTRTQKADGDLNDY
ncbi:hypothetical protein BH18ACT4_BH18ACT4_00130 [soil metagenome]